MSTFDEMKTQVVTALNDKVPNLKCLLCQNTDFILVDGFLNHSIQKEMTGGLILGGPVIPTVGVVCRKCGHLSEFSVGALGLIPKDLEIKNEKK